MRRGTNASGNAVTYLLNYSADPVTLAAPVAGRSVLADGAAVAAGDELAIGAWDLVVLES